MENRENNTNLNDNMSNGVVNGYSGIVDARASAPRGIGSEIEIRDRRSEELEIDLLELFAYFISRFKLLILCFLIGALLAAGYTRLMIDPKYTTSAKMYMVSSSSQSVVNISDLNLGQSLSGDYVELMKSRPILEDVIDELDLPYSYNALSGMIKLSVVEDTRVVKISATSTDPQEAMNIANAMAEQGVTALPKLMETPEPHIVEYATVPLSKSSPSMTRNTLMGGLIGLFIILALLAIQFLLDDTFKTAEDIEKEFGVMPLTVVPEGNIEGLSTGESEETNKSKSGRRSRKRTAKKNKK